MSLSARKFIAVLLAIWLPLFSGSVLAASVAMQLNSAQSQQSDDISMMDSCEQHAAHADAQEHGATHHGSGCNACGVCHLACSGYLAVSDLTGSAVQQSVNSDFNYLLSFDSITSIPLLPPPLVRV